LEAKATNPGWRRQSAQQHALVRYRPAGARGGDPSYYCRCHARQFAICSVPTCHCVCHAQYTTGLGRHGNWRYIQVCRCAMPIFPLGRHPMFAGFCNGYSRRSCAMPKVILGRHRRRTASGTIRIARFRTEGCSLLARCATRVVLQTRWVHFLACLFPNLLVCHAQNRYGEAPGFYRPELVSESQALRVLPLRHAQNSTEARSNYTFASRRAISDKSKHGSNVVPAQGLMRGSAHQSMVYVTLVLCFGYISALLAPPTLVSSLCKVTSKGGRIRTQSEPPQKTSRNTPVSGPTWWIGI
jgi:hypothetical protein